MKDKRFFPILMVVFVILMTAVGSSFAQDIDISNMDNAQLISLLQAIVQKLENEAEAGTESEGLNQLSIEKTDDMFLRIYENKKLIIERLPDYYFIQPQIIAAEEDVPPDPGKKEDSSRKKDSIDCNEYCINKCIYTYGDPMCTAECLATCNR